MRLMQEQSKKLKISTHNKRDFPSFLPRLSSKQRGLSIKETKLELKKAKLVLLQEKLNLRIGKTEIRSKKRVI